MSFEVDDALKAVARRYASGLITSEYTYRTVRDYLEYRDMRPPGAYEVAVVVAEAVKSILSTPGVRP